MAIIDLISDYRKHNNQLLQLVKSSNHREIELCDRRVALAYDRILNENPTDEAEVSVLVEYLVECLVTFPTDSSLNRRAAEKIASLTSRDAKQAIFDASRESNSHSIA